MSDPFLIATGALAAAVANVLLPPPEYETGRLPEFTITLLAEPELLKACAVAGEQPMGCTLLWSDDRCEVYIRADADVKSYAILLRHELAHCRGWAPDHPGGRHQ